MKTITLTQNQVALVDDEDYDYLNQFKWSARWCPKIQGYYAKRSVATLNGKQTTECMHRVIMATPKGLVVDHINHNTLDNQKANLRNVTHRKNISHRKNKSQCYSQYTGVTWHKRSKKWQANIRVNGKTKFLGLFLTEIEGHNAYMTAKVLYGI